MPDSSTRDHHQRLTLSSAAFANGTMIPARHTCDGDNRSPPLSWSGVPAAAQSLVLIVDDPDAPDPAAPKMTWVHWLLYNLPPDTVGLPEGVSAADLPSGTLQGRNDWQRTGYGGPCPPLGTHRYFHRLHALDSLLPDLRHPSRAVLERAFRDHILASSELVGLYRRQR